MKLPSKIQLSWDKALKNKNFTVALIVTVLFLVALTRLAPYFFINILQPKPGTTLADPILNFFQPKDWSLQIFVALYLTVLTSILLNFRKPDVILLGLQTYTLVNYLRLFTMYFFTLEPPDGAIPLNDPLINSFAYGERVFLKDLFFSGHMASLSVLYFIEPRKIFKRIILLVLLLVALLLAWQRVHYAIDLVAAPFFTWLACVLFSKTSFKTYLKNT